MKPLESYILKLRSAIKKAGSLLILRGMKENKI